MAGEHEIAVDRERWERAQRWELEFWQREQRRRGWRRLAYALLRPALVRLGHRLASGDDWNLWWRDQFEQYRLLPGHLGDYIELGCGPYTNTRLILEGRTADRIVCSDPLAGEYLAFSDRWLARAHKRGEIEVDAHAIEELPFPPASFDTVVLINVLDHVRDLPACMRTAIDLLRDGGILVFGQDLADETTHGASEYGWYEEGHPIRVTRPDVRPFLDELEPMLDRIVPARDERLQEGVLLFVGRKRDGAAETAP